MDRNPLSAFRFFPAGLNLIGMLHTDRTAFRVAMARAGFRSLAELARGLKLPYSSVRFIDRGLVPSAKRRRYLAEQLGVEEGDLWKEAAPPAAGAAPPGA